MKKATLDQAAKILELISQSGRSLEWVQNELIGSGRLTDLLAVDNLRGVDVLKFRDILGIKCCSTSLLEYVSSISIPPSNERFVAMEKFVVNTGHNAPVKVSYIGDDFTRWFLEGKGKIENPFPGSELRCFRLKEDLLDTQIISELGGEEKVETSLIEIFTLMAKQSRGEKGILLTNGTANIFYVRLCSCEFCGACPKIMVCGGSSGFEQEA